MKLFRKGSRNTGRQRRPQSQTDTPSPNFGYRERSEASPGNAAAKRQTAPAAAKNFASYWLPRFGHIILLLALVASTINVLTLSGNAKVVPLTDSNATFLHSQEVYQQAADRLLAGTPLNHNKITINTSEISQKMVSQFPELADVSITLPLLAHRPIVYLQARQPALILATGSGSFVIDNTGKALLLTSQLPSDKQLNVPTVADQSGLEVKLNHQVLTADNVSFIQTVAGQLNAKNLTIASLSLPPQASELHVWITGQPYFIKFNLERGNARQQVGTVLATLDRLQHQSVTPAKYVDVRVDGRAYYQ